MNASNNIPEKSSWQAPLARLGNALREQGTRALFPPLSDTEKTSPSQPAMFLLYLCGTWLVVRFVILILVFFGVMPNPSFPWGFLHAVRPGVSIEFIELFMSLVLTLVVYVRFFYRYNDYLYHLNPTKTPADFLLDCLVAISGVAIIVASGNCILLAACFAALFLFAGLKYLQGYWVCLRKAEQLEENATQERALWTLNSRIMRRKFTYDVIWCGFFITLAMAGLVTSRILLAITFGVLVPIQLVYMYFGDPCQIAFRDMHLAPSLWATIRTAVRRVYVLSRPYSVPYVALVGLCGVLSGERTASITRLALSLSLGPTVWVSMLAFHDFAHRKADDLSRRGRARTNWLLIPIGLVLLLTAIGLGAIAGRWTLVFIVCSALLGVLYGITKGVLLLSNLVRGCVTAAGVLATGAMVGLTPSTFLIAAGIGFLDAAGNILGDVRDAQVDAKSGTKTIAVVSSRCAVVACALLFVVAVALFSTVVPTVVPLSVLGVGAVMLAPRRHAHLWFLLGKYSFVGVIALSLPGTAVKTGVVCTLSLLAIPSMIAYRRMHNLRTPAIDVCSEVRDAEQMDSLDGEWRDEPAIPRK